MKLALEDASQFVANYLQRPGQASITSIVGFLMITDQGQHLFVFKDDAGQLALIDFGGGEVTIVNQELNSQPLL